jgi:hypothetical protein
LTFYCGLPKGYNRERCFIFSFDDAKREVFHGFGVSLLMAQPPKSSVPGADNPGSSSLGYGKTDYWFSASIKSPD